MRLTEPYAGTGRTVYGDSWFASVNTALAMRWQKLNFVGCVKTAHKHFPKKTLKAFCNARNKQLFLKKDFKVVPRYADPDDYPTASTVTLYAGGHCDKVPLCLIATRGKSCPGPHKMRWYRTWKDGEIESS